MVRYSFINCKGKVRLLVSHLPVVFQAYRSQAPVWERNAPTEVLRLLQTFYCNPVQKPSKISIKQNKET